MAFVLDGNGQINVNWVSYLKVENQNKYGGNLFDNIVKDARKVSGAATKFEDLGSGSLRGNFNLATIVIYVLDGVKRLERQEASHEIAKLKDALIDEQRKFPAESDEEVAIREVASRLDQLDMEMVKQQAASLIKATKNFKEITKLHKMRERKAGGNVIAGMLVASANATEQAEAKQEFDRYMGPFLSLLAVAGAGLSLESAEQWERKRLVARIWNAIGDFAVLRRAE